MGVIFFSTLLAVALGCGIGSKARKGRKRQESGRQATTPSDRGRTPDASGTWQATEAAADAEEILSCKESFPAVAGRSGTVVEFPLRETCLERGRTGDNATVSARVRPSESGKEAACDVPEREDVPGEGFSLRQAVIAQAILERKY